MKREKTEYGYIDYRKKRQFLMTLLMVLIGIAIYFLGRALNKGESSNVFTVAAILMVLPEKVMNLDFLWIEEGCVLGVLGKDGQELAYIQQYLSQNVRNWASDCRVKILGSYQELLKELTEQMKRSEKEKTEDLKKAKEYIRSLIV